MDRRIALFLACVSLSILAVQRARAQWAVVDAPAIVQLIQEVATAEQQLATARNQLLQTKQALQSMTGDRGMEQLLSGTNRNYLPSNWSQVTSAAQGAGSYGSLSADTQSIIATNAVLSPQRLGALSPNEQQLIQANRQWAAMQQALSHAALANASNRFASLQSLISSISSASDQKGILDLQARISAELGMLQNEQTKNQLLNQSALAQQTSLSLQAREQVLNSHGTASRFSPVP